jgi:predicted nucleotidyltransferase
MAASEYLRAVLASQQLGDDSAELKDLQSERAKVEEIIRKKFGSVPTIRYGGSKAKGDLIKESYDLDLICYFPFDSNAGGETLEDIYRKVRDCLSPHYYAEEKTSALRLIVRRSRCDSYYT